MGKSGHEADKIHTMYLDVSIKQDEWDLVGDWMWRNRKYYNGLSVLPYWDHTYTQAPFEDCDSETLKNYYQH